MEKPLKRIFSTEVFFGIMIMLLLALISLHEVVVFYKAEQEKLAQNFANLSNALECRLNSSFNIVENSLRYLKKAYEAGQSEKEIRQIFQSFNGLDNSLFMLVSLIDKDGNFVMTNSDLLPTTSISDRNYFKHHQDFDDNAIFIDSPSWGRIYNLPYIPITIRLNDKQGNFAGVIVISINMLYISDIFRSLHFDFDFQVYLADTAGRIYNGVRHGDHKVHEIDGSGEIKFIDGKRALNDDYFSYKKSPSLLDGSSIVYKRRENLRANSNAEYSLYMVFEIFNEKRALRMRENVLGEAMLLVLSGLIIALFFYIHGSTVAEKDKKYALLKTQSDKLNNLFNATGVATWEWNLQTDEVIINQNFADMYGYSMKELTPMNVKKWHSMIISEDRAKIDQIFSDHISGATSTYEYECRVKQKSENIIWIHTIGKVVFRDKDGKPLWLYGVDQDISDIKNAQDVYNQNQKLESIGTLAGGIAHEFNNILAGVYGYIELALLRIQDEKVKHFLRSSVASIDKAKQLTAKFVTFSEGGQLVITSAVIEFFLRKSITSIIKNREYTFSFHNMTDVWSVFYDKNQILNVLTNIIHNAMEAMPSGGHVGIAVRNIHIATHKVLSPGNYVKISIADDGEGLAPELSFRVYDPFYTTKPGRQGLGLTVSYSIMKKHNGCIDYEPNPRGGTIFNLYLPADMDSTEITDNDTINEQSLGKILILEEDEASRDIFVQLLSILGYDVLISYNTEQALKLLYRFHKDGLKAVIIDLECLRVAKSYGIIKTVRSVSEDLAVFITSTDTEDPIMKNPKQYLFTDCIPKPFIMLDLESKIEEHCQK